MREIKFRAWTGRKMRPWELLKNLKTVMLSSILAGEHRGYIPMQFTGLLDKNGREIYEGDIVSDGVYSYEMIWCEGLYGWMYDDTYSGNLFIPNEIVGEVIGNIHENPELINR